MILTLVAATAVIAAAAGYFAARRRAPAEAPPRALPPMKGASSRALRKSASGKSAPPPVASPFDSMPLALGDVIAFGGEERWLAGALVAREGGRVVSALFLSPEGATVQAIASFILPRREIYWLAPTEIDSPAEPPATLEIGGAMLTRRGRIPVSIERLGQGAPSVGGAALWATYEGGGREVALVLASEGRAYAWVGKRLDGDEYDRMGAAGTD